MDGGVGSGAIVEDELGCVPKHERESVAFENQLAEQEQRKEEGCLEDDLCGEGARWELGEVWDEGGSGLHGDECPMV